MPLRGNPQQVWRPGSAPDGLEYQIHRESNWISWQPEPHGVVTCLEGNAR
jgi:hypothetical protein